MSEQESVPVGKYETYKLRLKLRLLDLLFLPVLDLSEVTMFLVNVLIHIGAFLARRGPLGRCTSFLLPSLRFAHLS